MKTAWKRLTATIVKVITMSDKKTFVGIADCHGLESFLPMEGNEKQLGFLVMRANANRHAALVYQVELDEHQEALIKTVLEGGGYIKACQMLAI